VRVRHTPTPIISEKNITASMSPPAAALTALSDDLDQSRSRSGAAHW
jgi:hypothetical protein